MSGIPYGWPDRDGMPVQSPYNADNDRDAKAEQKHVGREHKNNPGGADSAQIDDRENSKDYHTERERVREKNRNRGDERAYPCGDRNGHVKHIVD